MARISSFLENGRRHRAHDVGRVRLRSAAKLAPILQAVADQVRDEAQALADLRRVALRISKTEGDSVARHLRMFHEDAETLARLVLAYTEPPDDE